MDWFDEYLNELDRPLPVAHLPPDQATWNKPMLNLQQKRFFSEQKAYMDLERQALIAEGRRQEEEQGMGGSYGSIDSGSSPTGKEGPVVPSTPPGPSPFALTYLIEELAYNGESITYGA